MIPFLDLKQQHHTLRKELLESFDVAISNAAFVGGDAVNKFEQSFADYLGVKHCAGVSNGTDSLRLALESIGIGLDDVVITVPNTFIATTEAISQTGASFKFVDIDPDTCLMDPNKLESYLSSASVNGLCGRIKAIIPVHLYGQCVDMDSFKFLADKYDFLLIEDAAQAHGAKYKGIKAGSIGDIGSFSFYPGKNLGACGDAGAVVSNNSDYIEKINILKDHGQKIKYLHEVEGYNNRMDAIQAMFLSIKLPHLDAWNAQRRKVATRYDEAFASIKEIKPIKLMEYNESSHHLYVIHIDGRENFCEYLKTKGIGFGLHYPTSLHLQNCYAHCGYRVGDFPISEWSAANLLSLPIYPSLNSTDQDYIIESTMKYYE